MHWPEYAAFNHHDSPRGYLRSCRFSGPTEKASVEEDFKLLQVNRKSVIALMQTSGTTYAIFFQVKN